MDSLRSWVRLPGARAESLPRATSRRRHYMRKASRAVPSISFFTQSLVRALGSACAASLLLTTPALAGPEDPKAAPKATIGEAAAEAAAQAAPAADPVLEWFKKVEIAGLIDTYYTYNFNEPPT